jgi:ligand-binding SRPBCC domain-containing protein
MTLHRLERSQVLPVAPEEAWGFFTDPRNLARITPTDMAFEVTSALPTTVYPGLMITYRVRPLFGLGVQWVTEITHVDEGARFVDEQRIGSYRLWHHEHSFRPAEKGTEVHDLVCYALPLGPAGELAHPLIRSRLQRIFDYRSEVLSAIFGRASLADACSAQSVETPATSVAMHSY